MSKSLSKIRISSLFKGAAAISAAILLPACGGGGGGGDPATQAAPQTLNALTLTLATGFDMTFIRDAGDTLNGVDETGTVLVTMTNDGETAVGEVREVGAGPVTIAYTNDVFLVDYTYTRNADGISGQIRIQGSSSADPAASYFTATFDYTYDISFGTDGSTITGLVLTDITADPDLSWLNASLQVYNGAGSVPVGYTVQLSNGQSLPYLYPEPSLEDVQKLRTDPTAGGPSLDDLEYTFTSSDTRTTTVQDGTTYTLSETGAAQQNNIDAPANISVEYEYSIDALTIDKARLRIYIPTKAVSPDPTWDYQLTFGDGKSGTYVDSVSGQTGDFELPVLEN